MNIKSLCIPILLVQLTSCGKQDHRYVQGYVEGENIYLASPYSGQLIKKNVFRGQPVKSGQLLFQLDENPQALTVKQSKANLLQAKKTYDDLVKPRRKPEIEAIQEQIAETDAQIVLAEIRVRRNQTLFLKHAIDRDSTDAAEANYNALLKRKKQYLANLELAKLGSREEQINAQQAQILALTAQLFIAKWELAQKSVYAPADGLIVDTYFSKGDFVPAQQSLAALLTPSNTRIEFFLPAKALASIKIGQAIKFTCDGCVNPSSAHISYVSPEVEYMPPLVYSRDNSDKLVFRIKANIDNNPLAFKPGQPVMVDLDNGQ